MHQLVEKYGMIPHPEGGYFVETYRSPFKTQCNDGKTRNTMTSIIYLLGDRDYSTFHRIYGEELWYHHEGNDMEVHMICSRTGKYTIGRCGKGWDSKLQILVPEGYWFAAKPILGDRFDYSCCACVVSPGFEFEDFEIAKRRDLLEKFPQHKDIITLMTRDHSKMEDPLLKVNM
jgi:predicted cupin superfamily sugar epimerase